MPSIACPGGCGKLVDYDAVPSYSIAKQRVGKFCDCGCPLDEASAAVDVLQYGPDTKAVTDARLAAIQAFQGELAKAREAKPVA